MNIIHKYTTTKDIFFNYYGKGKIPCVLIEYFGRFREHVPYDFCYKQDILIK